MESQEILSIASDAIITLIKIGAPVLLVALVVGLIISLIQAMTQIQESTISFVPKLLAILLCLLLFFPYIGSNIRNFNERIMERIVGIP